jgi:hypothetical protein
VHWIILATEWTLLGSRVILRCLPDTELSMPLFYAFYAKKVEAFN